MHDLVSTVLESFKLLTHCSPRQDCLLRPHRACQLASKHYVALLPAPGMCCWFLSSCVLMSSGTFLYVAFMEVIPRELAVPNHRTAKLAMLMLGFGAMSLLAIWA